MKNSTHLFSSSKSSGIFSGSFLFTSGLSKLFFKKNLLFLGLVVTFLLLGLVLLMEVAVMVVMAVMLLVLLKGVEELVILVVMAVMAVLLLVGETLELVGEM